MHRKTITLHIPLDWFEPLNLLANNKGQLPSTYIREMVRAHLNQPTSITDFSKRTFIHEGNSKPTQAAQMVQQQIVLPRKARHIILGMAVKTGWSVQYILQRILETDLAPLTPRAVMQPVKHTKLSGEYSPQGMKLGEAYWKEYYELHPEPANYKVSFRMPIDWQDQLNEKAESIGISLYRLVRSTLLTRLNIKENDDEQ